MHPLVSILIPAYNAQAWIGETLRSAIEQSWPNKEIIVVDDGSSDDTCAVAREFTGHGIRVISQKNQGASAARNHAFSLAKGDFIQWLDADDLLSADKISCQMAAVAKITSRRVLLSCGWGYFMHRPSKAEFTPTALWCDSAPLEWMVRKWEGNAHMQTATWLVSRELTAAAGPWDSRLSFDDDGEYFFRVINASERIKFVPESKVFYRVAGSSRLSNIGRSNKKLDSQFLSMKTQIAALRAVDDSARTRAACVNYLQTWLVHFHPDRPDIVEEASRMANSLGGRISLPRLSWKYAWIRTLFGWSAAKSAQLNYNGCKITLKTKWDKAMARVERGSRSSDPVASATHLPLKVPSDTQTPFKEGRS